MSSRSLAAARARRSAESAPPVSGNRPVTSIGSIAQQMPQGMGYAPSSNVRTAKAMSRSPAPPQQQQQQQQFYEQPQQTSNGLPFSKISISDAIGLITLRLGRVEQWVIETEHEQDMQEGNEKSSGSPILDNSVLNTLVNRIEALEKTASSSTSTTSLEELTTLKEQVARIGDDVTKHTLELAKNTEQVFRFNRELTETKDILKSFMVKYDFFAQEMTQNLSDYETALGDLEKRLPQATEEATEAVEEDAAGGTNLSDLYAADNVIMSTDLKSIIKQELSGN
jgi:hypothetical protein